jgi:hypothetical protein
VITIDGLTFAQWCAEHSEFERHVCGDCGLDITPGTHRACIVLGNWFARCFFEYSE